MMPMDVLILAPQLGGCSIGRAGRARQGPSSRLRRVDRRRALRPARPQTDGPARQPGPDATSPGMPGLASPHGRTANGTRTRARPDVWPLVEAYRHTLGAAVVALRLSTILLF